MKRVLLFSLFLLIGLVSCVPDGETTIVFPEDTTSELPEIFQSTWHAAIKCQQESQAALFIKFTTESNSLNLYAKGEGYDYDDAEIQFEIDGIYNKSTNILKASVNYYFPETAGVRKDSLIVNFNDYDYNTYLPMRNYYFSYDLYGCDSEILLSKTKLGG